MSNKLLREFIRCALTEGPRGSTGRQVGAPYRGGRFSLGWGTGMSGGNMAMTRADPRRGMGGQPNMHGGSTIKSNPIKPYSDEFVDDNETKRHTEFDARVSEFMGSVEALKKALSLARSSSDFDDALAVFFGESGIDVDDVLDGSGAFDALIRNGEVEKARHSLVTALDSWAKKRIEIAAANSEDAGYLDDFGTDSSSFKQTISGMYRWS